MNLTLTPDEIDGITVAIHNYLHWCQDEHAPDFWDDEGLRLIAGAESAFGKLCNPGSLL